MLFRPWFRSLIAWRRTNSGALFRCCSRHCGHLASANHGRRPAESRNDWLKALDISLINDNLSPIPTPISASVPAPSVQASWWNLAPAHRRMLGAAVALCGEQAP